MLYSKNSAWLLLYSALLHRVLEGNELSGLIQLGFKLNTETVLVALVNLWQKYVEHIFVFLDLSAAFNTTNHDILLEWFGLGWRSLSYNDFHSSVPSCSWHWQETCRVCSPSFMGCLRAQCSSPSYLPSTWNYRVRSSVTLELCKEYSKICLNPRLSRWYF